MLDIHHLHNFYPYIHAYIYTLKVFIIYYTDTDQIQTTIPLRYAHNMHTVMVHHRITVFFLELFFYKKSKYKFN